jgi:hypothetical protein
MVGRGEQHQTMFVYLFQAHLLGITVCDAYMTACHHVDQHVFGLHGPYTARRDARTPVLTALQMSDPIDCVVSMVKRMTNDRNSSIFF